MPPGAENMFYRSTSESESENLKKRWDKIPTLVDFFFEG